MPPRRTGCAGSATPRVSDRRGEPALLEQVADLHIRVSERVVLTHQRQRRLGMTIPWLPPHRLRRLRQEADGRSPALAPVLAP